MWECVFAYSVQVSTHLAMLSTLYISLRLRQWTMSAVGGSTLLVSLLYHVAEVMNNQFCYHPHYGRRLLLGLDDGRWHVLDNVFAILSLQLLCVHLSVLSAPLEEMLRWGGLLITLVFQQRNPWDLTNTILPIVPYAVLFFVRLLVARPPLQKRAFSLGVLCMVPAALFFIRGLDAIRTM